MKAVIGAMSLAVSATALAQTAPAPRVAPSSPVLPENLAAARPVIDKLWPLGTYRRLIEGTMNQVMDAMMDQMMGMRGRDMVPEGMAGSDKAKAEAGDKSLGELAAEKDPYFRERTRRMTAVMSKEMIPLIEKAEPSVRESMVRIYARKFTPAQLNELSTFLSTPTGQAYSREWLTSFMDPEIVRGMQSFMPDLMKAMPGIMAKVQEATKDLPPPPKPAK